MPLRNQAKANGAVSLALLYPRLAYHRRVVSDERWRAPRYGATVVAGFFLRLGDISVSVTLQPTLCLRFLEAYPGLIVGPGSTMAVGGCGDPDRGPGRFWSQVTPSCSCLCRRLSVTLGSRASLQGS